MAALAARCSSCGTVFRVVQDQLRVADGLVRCGRCGEVFNAAASLLDLPAAAPAAAPAGPPPVPSNGTDFELEIESPEAEPEAPSFAEAEAETEAEAEAAVDPEADPGTDPGPDPEGDWPTAPGPAAFAADTVAMAEPAAEPTTVREAEQPTDPTRSAAPPVPVRAPPGDAEQPPDFTPSFMRHAERAQRWRQPRRRAALAIASGLGLLLLAGQLTYIWRDQLATSLPALRVPLLAACAALRCRIEPVRAIDSLAVDNSGLARVEGSSIYRLQVTLRNRAAQPVAVPDLDVTLNDSSGKPLARRVLRAADLGVTDATLAAGRGLPLQATLQTRFPGKETVTGYTIELFYP
jgi:predicted Zn finger-like uncharacterized protein